MPALRTFARNLIASDEIELGGHPMFITDVELDNSVDGKVKLSMHSTAHEDYKATVEMDRFLHVRVYRK